MRVVHAKRPEDFNVVLFAEIGHDLQRVSPRVKHFFDRVLREQTFFCLEDIAHFRVVGEHPEPTAPRAIENRIDVGIHEGRRAMTEQFVWCRILTEIDRFVSVVIKDDPPLALRGRFPVCSQLSKGKRLVRSSGTDCENQQNK
ncbi:hypothetical protein [Rosistilla oblonga]|uniref:hypothetical protein n=1 Tax=Rosistilla oblonga TaxID=2527990 RepID=UPI003A96CDE0